MKVLKNFLVLGIVLSIVSCNKNIDAEKKNQVKESSNVIGITINDYYVEINPRIDGQWVEPMSMRGDEDNSIAFGEFTGWHIKIGESEIQSNSTVGIKPDNGILKKVKGLKLYLLRNKQACLTLHILDILIKVFQI